MLTAFFSIHESTNLYLLLETLVKSVSKVGSLLLLAWVLCFRKLDKHVILHLRFVCYCIVWIAVSLHLKLLITMPLLIFFHIFNRAFLIRECIFLLEVLHYVVMEFCAYPNVGK